MNYARMYGRDDRIWTCDILLPTQSRRATKLRHVPKVLSSWGTKTLLIPRR